jgi:hypothetical protein
MFVEEIWMKTTGLHGGAALHMALIALLVQEEEWLNVVLGDY